MAELAYSGDGPHPHGPGPIPYSPPGDWEAQGPHGMFHTSVFEPENHFEDVTFGFKRKRENFKQSPG